MDSNDKNIEVYRLLIQKLYKVITIGFILILLMPLFLFSYPKINLWFNSVFTITDESYAVLEQKEEKVEKQINFWKPVDINLASDENLKSELEYGKDLIMHTSKYLGPKGSVKQISNGMNCNNCHLDAGTKVWGNNYGSVFSMYPKFRARSGQVEDLFKRVNDCMQRSLNGQPLNETDREMKAMIAYIEYIGKDVPKKEEAVGSGIYDLEYLDRAADPAKGKELYASKCASCHQPNGEGVLTPDKSEYTYPPLWGKNSFNIGAGLYRLSRFAGYVKYNMPLGATFENSQLSDEEAWDLAAFVNSQPRPKLDISQDWPDISKKPVDHPFGPFSDHFSEKQHKFGPFTPIKKEKKKHEKK